MDIVVEKKAKALINTEVKGASPLEVSGAAVASTKKLVSADNPEVEVKIDSTGGTAEAGKIGGMDISDFDNKEEGYIKEVKASAKPDFNYETKVEKVPDNEKVLSDIERGTQFDLTEDPEIVTTSDVKLKSITPDANLAGATNPHNHVKVSDSSLKGTDKSPELTDTYGIVDKNPGSSDGVIKLPDDDDAEMSILGAAGDMPIPYDPEEIEDNEL